MSEDKHTAGRPRCWPAVTCTSRSRPAFLARHHRGRSVWLALGRRPRDDLWVAQLPEGIRASFRLFAFYFANGTLVMDLLEDFDYRSAVMAYGSALEQAFRHLRRCLGR